MLGLGILDSVLQQAGKLQHRLVHPVFLDGSNFLEDRRERDGFLNDVGLLQKLAQELGQFIGHHVGEFVGVGQLDDFKQRLEVSPALLAVSFLEGSGNGGVFQTLEPVGQSLRCSLPEVVMVGLWHGFLRRPLAFGADGVRALHIGFGGVRARPESVFQFGEVIRDADRAGIGRAEFGDAVQAGQSIGLGERRAVVRELTNRTGQFRC